MNEHETHVDQRDAGRRTARGHRRRTDALRHRYRAAVEGTEEVQHLQGPHHPARTLARSRLHRVRRRPPRDRKSVVSGKSVSVRVDLGGRRIINKKNEKTNTAHKLNKEKYDDKRRYYRSN